MHPPFEVQCRATTFCIGLLSPISGCYHVSRGYKGQTNDLRKSAAFKVVLRSYAKGSCFDRKGAHKNQFSLSLLHKLFIKKKKNYTIIFIYTLCADEAVFDSMYYSAPLHEQPSHMHTSPSLPRRVLFCVCVARTVHSSATLRSELHDKITALCTQHSIFYKINPLLFIFLS
jgi:hypothetical protein